MSLVVVVDHGLCNLGSVRRALEECGARVVVSRNPADLATATHVVLPGVGAFNAAMAQLRSRGWDVALRQVVEERRMPLLGICLGMQLLASHGDEGGRTDGLGLIAGEVKRMEPARGERLPHVGWNSVNVIGDSPLFTSIGDGSDFYFVHNFHVVPERAECIVASAPYCGGFAAAVQSGSVYGVQFHPEKSSKAGFQILRNFLAR